MTTSHIAVRESYTVVGDINDTRPCLRDFGIASFVAMRPLPFVNPRKLPEGADYANLPSGRVHLADVRERAAAIVEEIRQGATLEAVVEKHGCSTRQAFRYFAAANVQVRHRSAS